MTPEGRRRRQEAWQVGQSVALDMMMSRVTKAIEDLPRDEQVEYLRGIGQWFSSKAHELAKEEE